MAQPVLAESLEMLPPTAYLHMPASNFTTKFVIGNLNKAKSPINHVTWTPDGRRCMTGATSGEFTVWDGRTFNWESVLQAHEAPVRCMQYTHNEHIIISSDDNGRIKLWNGRKDNFLDPLHVISAHREPCRSISIAPTDRKFVSASDDSTIKVHDFVKGGVETTMMGHGGDVRWVDWHPRMGLIASGSKDALTKLWDPRSHGTCVVTLHGHKNGIMQVKWNPNNANWLLTASRDQTLKIYDLRTLRELGTYQGHSRDVTCCAWHPVHEELFVSGSYDGGINYWLASRPDPQAVVQGAHDKEVWSVAWHPVGHLLASGSADLCTKFWCRPRPGDIFQERLLDETDGLGLGFDFMGFRTGAGSVASAAAPSAAATAAGQPPTIPGLNLPGAVPGLRAASAMPLGSGVAGDRGAPQASSAASAHAAREGRGQKRPGVWEEEDRRARPLPYRHSASELPYSEHGQQQYPQQQQQYHVGQHTRGGEGLPPPPPPPRQRGRDEEHPRADHNGSHFDRQRGRSDRGRPR
eukprot:CAMPEP_0202375406 /NCGR_PEP_ID=MMETSP1127-20130417/6090_1 /ASSEMBLY_ACC=CAM_ASM_000462 /TAXON_ID=3047 /ORGANISM="Dunaliella tertiolecta, Strain CCMP1320" /LENGTH=521 /DNA_ID=CAMNT_0048972873 /DNA_START=382 /DNA_END=1947 /DNA_ORIENTATION=-